MITISVLFFTNQIALVLISVSFSVFTLIQQEELMGWHPSAVKRTGLLKYANLTKPVAEIEEVVVLGTNLLVIPDTR